MYVDPKSIITPDGTEFIELQITKEVSGTVSNAKVYATIESVANFANGISLPPSSAYKILYNNNGGFGAFTVSGDGTLDPRTGVLSITKTEGVSFATVATTGSYNDLKDKPSTPSSQPFTGATAGADGTQGLVPKPTAGQQGYILYGDGTFKAQAGGGNVSNTGTPVAGQIAVWTNATTIGGTNTIQSNGASASSTGFSIGDGTDLGVLFAATFAAANKAFTAASGSGTGYGSNPKITAVSLARVSTTAVLTATTACDCNCNCNCSADCNSSSCFVATSVVMMADGTLKYIKDILPGEHVRGRFGEANQVLALDRVLLGRRPLYFINGWHVTTDEHPHWTTRGPAAIRPESLEDDWGRYHPVILKDGSTQLMKNIGLSRKVNKLQKDDFLIGIHGLHAIERLEQVDGHPSLPLYNLVLGGSHTYFVDGLLVTGWPREDDFDYDTWHPRCLEAAA